MMRQLNLSHLFMLLLLLLLWLIQRQWQLIEVVNHLVQLDFFLYQNTDVKA